MRKRFWITSVIESGDSVHLETKCVYCGVVKVLTMTKTDYDKWQSGELLQNVVPNWKSGDREVLISGLCDACFDEIFSPK